MQSILRIGVRDDWQEDVGISRCRTSALRIILTLRRLCLETEFSTLSAFFRACLLYASTADWTRLNPIWPSFLVLDIRNESASFQR